MLSPTTTTTTTTAAAAGDVAATNYTTIPIPGGDVISRSIQNLSNSISRHRPWAEFIDAGVVDRPESLSAAGTRIRRNAKYFSINYAIVISICVAFSLIVTPLALIVYASVFALWLILCFFREDPMVVWGRHVSDQVVIGLLVVVSVAAVCVTGMVNNLLSGIAVGLFLSAVHGALRNPEGLFLDEDDAASNGLIGSALPSNSHRKDFWI